MILWGFFLGCSKWIFSKTFVHGWWVNVIKEAHHLKKRKRKKHCNFKAWKFIYFSFWWCLGFIWFWECSKCEMISNCYFCGWWWANQILEAHQLKKSKKKKRRRRKEQLGKFIPSGVWPCTLKLDEEMSKHASLGSGPGAVWPT